MRTSNLQVTAIIVGLVLNIFIAGVGWGTLWTKVTNLEKRFDRLELNTYDNQNWDRSRQTPSNPRGRWSWQVPVSPPEARADTNSLHLTIPGASARAVGPTGN